MVYSVGWSQGRGTTRGSQATPEGVLGLVWGLGLVRCPLRADGGAQDDVQRLCQAGLGVGSSGVGNFHVPGLPCRPALSLPVSLALAHEASKTPAMGALLAWRMGAFPGGW